MAEVKPRPFLKWAGGKGQLIEQYLPYFPKSYSRYFEPFLGGGAIFFYLGPQQATLSDINPELVNVYRCIRDDVESIISLLQKHKAYHTSEYYYQIRSFKPEDPVERAARLLYLNKTCFNGLYRENSRGEFNVPMGRYKNPQICDQNLLRAAAVALGSAQVRVQQFWQIVDHATSPEDFVYLDPPYHPLSTTSSFTSYSQYPFREAEQTRLRDVFITLAKSGVKAMLSNSDCSFIRALYADFPIHTINASRAINSHAARRGKITEILVTSY